LTPRVSGSIIRPVRLRVVVVVAAVGIAWSFGLAGAIAGPRIDLATRLSILTTGTVRKATVGDFDEDGIPDIAVVHQNGVEILRGLGSGRFESSASIATTVSGLPTTLVATDLNHDGHLDLVMPGQSGGAVTVLLGDGRGDFTGPADYGTALPSENLAVADLNGDTYPDVAMAPPDTNIVDIFPGDGEGRFLAAPTVITIPTYSPHGADIVARDFNGDGKTDLVIGVGSVLFLPGDGLGGFGTPVFSFSPGSLGLTSADFDGDGVPDLATHGHLSGGGGWVMHGTGDGHFILGSELYVPNVRDAEITSGDLNGDGRPDVAVSGHSNPIIVFLATGPMQFGAGVPYEAAYGGSSDTLAIADFDQDGRQDLMVGSGGIDLSILRGDGLGRFPMETFLGFPSLVADIGATDFDGDGMPDLAVLDGPAVSTCSGPQPGTIDCGASMQVQVRPGTGQALFGPSISSPARCAPTALAIADFNRDGRPDVATANRGARGSAGVCYAASLSVLAGDGHGQLVPFVDLPVPNQPDDLVPGDFDEDGIPDLAVAFANAGLVAVYRLAPGPALVPAATWIAPASPGFLAAGDLDGDGHLDLAVAISNGEVAVLRGDGDGLILPAAECAPGPGGGTGPVSIGDFDGDGRREIAATGTKSVRVMQVAGTGTACATSFEIAIPAGAQGLGTRDLNGDGLDDLFVADGFGHVSTVASASLPPWKADDLYGINGARAVAIDDFDSDGLPDVAVASPLIGPYNRSVAVVRNITPAAAHLTLRVAGRLLTDEMSMDGPGMAAGGAASTLFWTGVLGATGYDIVRGSLAALRTGGGDFTSAVDDCLANDLPATVIDASDVPTAGDGWWFLTRPLFPAGPGSYDGEDPGQLGSRDAQLAASSLACP
jgi:adhesin/invasin